MSAPAECQLVGRWRIVEANIGGLDYLDRCGPATVAIGADNRGEIAFGAMQADLESGYSPAMVFFTWAGSDEMNAVSGEGDAELQPDGTIAITFAYHHGDEAVLKAVRHTYSTAC